VARLKSVEETRKRKKHMRRTQFQISASEFLVANIVAYPACSPIVGECIGLPDRIFVIND
jgi:hypothetical protein